MNLRDRQILHIALPSIVSNITVPLLGLVDVAIVGHMGSAVYIGAVAVGSMIFNLVYWLFAFLRMGSSGLTAQAWGRRDMSETVGILVRAVLIALLIALLLLVLQVPLCRLMFWLIEPTPDVLPLASTYFYMVIWGAPASLCLFVLTGWFIGMQNTRSPMLVSILQNVVNILVSLLLVYGLGMKIEGVALGTVVAQYAGLLVAAGLLWRYYGKILGKQKRISTLPFFNSSILQSFNPSILQSFHSSILQFFNPSILQFKIYRDLFLRTLCLVAVNLFFTAVGARQGAVVLSVNTVLLQMYLFFSYFMDGFAYAGEALGGKTYGARNMQAFRETLRHLWLWMVIVTGAFTLLYIIGGMQVVEALTDDADVRQSAADFIFWAWLVPASGCVAFIWDGVFVGITATRGMLVASFVAAIVFFTICCIPSAFHLPSSTVNHFLWLAQVVYLSMRGIVQTVWYRLKLSKLVN